MPKLKEEFPKLQNALKKDKAFRETWRSTISVCIQEEIISAKQLSKNPNIKTIADKAAEKFITLLCS